MGGSFGFHGFEYIRRDISHAVGCNGGARRNGWTSRCAVGFILMLERASRRTPEVLTRLLVRAFVTKMVVFGLYVVLATTVMSLDVVAFFVSFTLYFVALYLVEAFYVYRLGLSNRTSS